MAVSTSTAPLSLGNFDFKGFSTPESVSYGGKRELVVHKLPGGMRIIQDMGADPDNIVFSGFFLGADAEAQADELERLRDLASKQTLVFGSNSFIVAIESVTLSRSAWKVAYTVTCVVMSVTPQVTPEANTLQGVSQDVATASAVDDLPDEVTTPLSAASGLLKGLGTVSQTLAQLQNVRSAAQGILSDAMGDIQSIGFIGQGSSTVAQTVGAITDMRATLLTAAHVSTANGYVGKAIQSLGLGL